MAELIPQPLDRLLARALGEHERQRSIFGVPKRSFWQPRDGLDLSVALPGGRAQTPLGPAAGPHTQLAPNIVAAWLAGSRVIELKTVQVLDRLEIPRPCIDAPGPGWNVEWSQELRLEDSARQYAIAWLIVHVLAARGIAGAGGVPGAVFDASVGYDLAGIQSARVARFLDTLRDAGALLAELREGLPRELRAAADVPVPAGIADTVTLSSFHGCPPDEIERIVEHLIKRHALHVVVKLNPTLLGFDAVRELLCERLGWRDVVLDRTAFEKDLQWSDALAMLTRVRGVAARAGRTLGVKLTNTLVVKNTRGRLAGDLAYLSGPPLHAIAVTLAAKLAGATGGAHPLSFSAGANAENFADLVACGFAPVTTCTDLLQPTGYRRLPRYLKALEAEMERLGVRDVPSYVRARAGADATGALANLREYAARVADEARYRAAAQPATVGARPPLPVLDCESCNHCALVCPNVAFFAVDTPPELLASGALKREKQWLVRADACNACGNCDTHCPQAGGPWRVKPAVSAEGRVTAAGVEEAVRAALEGAAGR